MPTPHGQRIIRDEIPENELKRTEALMEDALRAERERRSRELHHSIAVLEFDEIRRRLAEYVVGDAHREDALGAEPAISVSEADQWQTQTASALRIIRRAGNFPLPLRTPAKGLIRRAKQGSVLSLEDLLHMGSFLTAVRRLTAMIPEPEDDDDDEPDRMIHEPMVDELRRLIPLPDLEREITRIVISEDDVADDATPRLAGIRRDIQTRQASIRQHLDRLIRSHSRALQEQLVTLRGDRYVVPVKVEHRGEVPGLVHGTSGSGQTLFVEPMAVVDANNAVAELRGQERDEILKIRAMLSADVGERAEILLVNGQVIRHIDLVCARARLAIDMDATRPKLNSDGRVNLRRARHPLIDPATVVPIDFHIGRTFRTLVITGPNTGGKTVTLKTMGLLTLMGMSGLHIPADEGSELAFFRQVLADIGDEQSIEQSLSTFSAHMRNLVRITELADGDSLVLADELGSGTDPSEGAALAVSILNHLRNRGATVVATTHYKEIKAYALETDGVENASCEFDVRTLKPTYRLLIGVPGVSHAFTISQKLGLSDAIIDAARSHLSTDTLRFEALIQSIEADRRALDTARAELDQATASLARDRKQLADKERKVQQKHDELRSRGMDETREALREKSRAIDELLATIRSDLAQSRFASASEDAETLREWISKDLNETERAIAARTKRDLKARGKAHEAQKPRTVQVGGTYFAPSLNFEGKVLAAPDKNGEVQLQAGVMTVNVPSDELRLPLSRQEKKQADRKGRSLASESEQRRRSERSASARGSAKATFGSELKLLGMRVDEALHALDAYLDRATLAGAERVRIVHGKGTGALRSAIHDQLRSDPRVRSFELAAFGEGDSGVTYADLK